jgi:Tol biopolymer transport system component
MRVTGGMSPDHPRPAAPLVGRHLGPYHVRALIGAGGMGEVYRAHDPKLGRDVALKILPADVTADPERLARFDREARALAALNHPNIATIHGAEAFDGTHALVLELVDGDTLADWIRRPEGGQIHHITRVAAQLAEALEAAHEKGIVHRDLKPANIKVTPDGVVKVLDFGLAKLAPAGDAASIDAPTLTIGGTREGVIAGTAAYMSPEQARGQSVDKRSDVWSFGCVLYEMLTRRPAFARDSLSETLAAVLEAEPDWDALPATTPPAIRRLLRRCLEKNPKQRLRDLGDARLDIADALDAQGSSAAPVPHIGRARIATRAAAAAAAIAIGVLLWALSRPSAPADHRVTRTTILVPPGQELDTGGGAQPLAISPDGRLVAYAATRGSQTELYVRSLDSFDARALAGTAGAQYPFFSPDGTSIAFFAERKLKRVAIRGGTPLTICDAPVVERGGTWGADGTIVFDPGASGLMRVSADGGTPERLTSRDAAMDAGNLSWPQFLPGGEALLATVGIPGSVNARLAALSLETGEWRPLGPGSQASYVPSGHVVYHAIHVREGDLHAIPFDADSLSVRGAAAPVLDSVFRAQNGGGIYFAVAQNGTLVFTPGGYARSLVRVDRHGRRTRLVDERRGFRGPAVSPDGRMIAVTIDPRPSSIWVYDLARRTGFPLAARGHNLAAAWTPDGRRVTYTNAGDIFWRAADASTPAERLLARERAQYATSWSARHRLLIFNDTQPDGEGTDIWAMPIDGQPYPLLATSDNEQDGQLSPDGRWLAYRSDESGQHEVYVRPFPNVNDRKWRISTAGGLLPLWSKDGRELFYAVGSTLMRVSVEVTDGTLAAAAPEALFTGPYDTAYANYDVTPDASQFIMIEVDPDARATQIHVVQNWLEELGRTTQPATR